MSGGVRGGLSAGLEEQAGPSVPPTPVTVHQAGRCHSCHCTGVVTFPMSTCSLAGVSFSWWPRRIRLRCSCAGPGRRTRPPSLLWRRQRHLWSSNTPQLFVHNHSTIPQSKGQKVHNRNQKGQKVGPTQPFVHNWPPAPWIDFEPLLNPFWTLNWIQTAQLSFVYLFFAIFIHSLICFWTTFSTLIKWQSLIQMFHLEHFEVISY